MFEWWGDGIAGYQHFAMGALQKGVIKICNDSDVWVAALNYFEHMLYGDSTEQRPITVILSIP
jgi:hypothetical protein